MAVRLFGLPPNLASHFTPGTLNSSYEVYEALKQGIAVPFRKNDPEMIHYISRFQAADRGGMMFQSSPTSTKTSIRMISPLCIPQLS